MPTYRAKIIPLHGPIAYVHQPANSHSEAFKLVNNTHKGCRILNLAEEIVVETYLGKLRAHA